MNELLIHVTQEEDGGYIAQAEGEGIFTQADSREELYANVRDAVKAYYFDGTVPATVRLRFTREELIPVV